MEECDGEEMCVFFFFNDTATTEIYTLSLHDALPIFETTLDSWFLAEDLCVVQWHARRCMLYLLGVLAQIGRAHV